MTRAQDYLSKGYMQVRAMVNRVNGGRLCVTQMYDHLELELALACRTPGDDLMTAESIRRFFLFQRAVYNLSVAGLRGPVDDIPFFIDTRPKSNKISAEKFHC